MEIPAQRAGLPGKEYLLSFKKLRVSRYREMPLVQGIHNLFQLRRFVVKGYCQGFVAAELEFFDAFDCFEDSTYPLRRASGSAPGNGHPDHPFSGKRRLIRQRKQQNTDKQDIYFSCHESLPPTDSTVS